MSFQSSRSTLDIEGQKLLRQIVRAYYPLHVSVILAGFLHCLGEKANIGDRDIAEYQQLSYDVVTTTLTKLSQSMLISHDIQLEERVETNVNSRKPRQQTHLWGMDYETLVNAVHFKHSQILHKLNAPVQTIKYWCMNMGCFKFKKTMELDDVVVAHISRGSNGPTQLDEKISQQQSKQNNMTNEQHSFIVKKKRTSMGGGKSSQTIVTNLTPNAPTTGSSDKNTSEFRCETCDQFMQEVTSSSGQNQADLKRKFNTMTSGIAEQLKLVEDLLKHKHVLLKSKADEHGNARNGESGVGAKTGHGSVAGLASRSEVRKTSLAWEMQNEQEKESQALEDAYRKRLAEEEAFRERKRVQEEFEQSRQKALAQHELRAEEQEQIAKLIFGKQDSSAPSVSLQPQTTVVEEPLFVADADDVTFVDEEQTSHVVGSADVLVKVNGVEKPLSEITEEDMGAMDDAELMAYQEVMMQNQDDDDDLF